MTANTHPRILFLVTEDWYFCSHRLELARAARAAGFAVTVVTRVQAHADVIQREGFKLVPIALERRGSNPLKELKAIMQLARIYRSEQPDIVHHVALKPVLYGSVAARLAGVPHMVNALAGLGFVFSSERPLARLLRPLVKAAFRLLLNRRDSRVILQNRDDLALLTGSGVLAPGRVVVIRGSGVDLERYAPLPEAPGIPVVLLASRMLWDKGVGEFVEAARRLREGGVAARFVLVGEPDEGNPAAVPEARLLEWKQAGIVEWWGRRDDMPEVLAQSHIVCLPSYREGLPKVLLEAAACGRPIVASDVPGCREIVRHEENGLLVAVRDPAALADALRRLIGDADMRRRMGRSGRAMVEADFSVQRVVRETLDVYGGLLS